MIYITGDTHIPTDIQKLSTKRFPNQKELNENDYLIICGDFGGIWDNGNEEKYWLKWLDNKNFTTLFIDGNHENFDLLNKFPEVEFFGGKAHKISDKIFHLKRGHIFELDGKRIFAFGGASSHDKDIRKEGINWWREELPSPKEYEQANKNLEKVKWSVDYVITHCTAASIQHIINSSYEENELTDYFDTLKNKLHYKKWFFGHYHQDLTIDSQHIALFSNIVKI